MEKYLQQLKEDLRAAVRNVPDPDKGDVIETEGIEAHIAEVEKYLYGTPQPLSEIVGIDKLYLPPPEKLDEEQVAEVYPEMELLLEAYHFFPDFPRGLPAAIKYRLLRERWDHEYIHLQTGESHIEFCDYDTGNCPFPVEFCMCRDLEDDTGETEMKSGADPDDDIPF